MSDELKSIALAAAEETAKLLLREAISQLGGDVKRARELLSEEEISLANATADAIEIERGLK